MFCLRISWCFFCSEDEIRVLKTPDQEQRENSPDFQIRNLSSPDNEADERNSPDGVDTRAMSPVGQLHPLDSRGGKFQTLNRAGPDTESQVLDISRVGTFFLWRDFYILSK